MLHYLITLGVYAGFYAMMAVGLNLIWGLGGMVNLGLAGFYALGAYVSALLVMAGTGMLAGWVAAAAVAAVLGFALAAAVARLRGDYLAIVTLGFAETVRMIATNEIWLTNGIDGISGISGPLRSSLSPFNFDLLYLVIVWVIVGILVFIGSRVSRAPFGRVLRAISEDESVVQVAGKQPTLFKIKAFSLGAAMAGLAGALYAHYNSFIAPEAFQPIVTINVVLALTLGGLGNTGGAVLGGILIVCLLELTRVAAGWIPGLESTQLAALRQIIVGMFLILSLRYLPGGFLRERSVSSTARTERLVRGSGG